MSNNEQYFSGTSGLAVPIPKSQYPEAFQDKSRLSYYASLFNSIEINSIFYKLPKISTITNWAASVPENFRFTFKLSKTITHVKELNFSQKDITAFMNTISPAVNYKGCILVQFPPGLKLECFEKLKQLLECLESENQDQLWPIAIEFRNETWDHPEVFHLLDQYHITSVIHDMKGSAPLTPSFKTGFKYLRFHGPEGTYRGSYPDEILQDYAAYIKGWINEKQTVYVYFNNTMGDAIGNLRMLNSFVNAKT